MNEYKKIIEEYWKIILLAFAASSLLFIIYFNAIKDSENISEIDPYEELLAEDTGKGIEVDEELLLQEPSIPISIVIMADIKGAVNKPGVYNMESEDRIIDLVEKAGGLRNDAETNAVNFAQKVEDQMVVYIPRIGESDVIISEIPTTGEKDVKDDKININEADETSLLTLNGIGPSKAANILQHREEKGYFKTIDEIKNVSGIGEATFSNLKDFITVSQ